MQNRSSQVLLATGKLCLKGDLAEGAELLDDQTRPQVLKHIERRTVPAFEVRPLKGEPFLMGFDQKLFATALKNDSCVLLGIADYAKQPRGFRAAFGLVHATLQFPAKPLPLDPYFLGLLLGDGCFRGIQPCLTTPDPEIVETIYQTAEAHQWPLRVMQTPVNLSNAYYFKRGAPDHGARLGGGQAALGGHLAPLKRQLQALGLWGHKSDAKFIPPAYLYAARADRLALLAGLLDTDGYLQARHYEIVSASFELADNIAFLARSLAFGVVEKEKIAKDKRYARLFIYGDFSDVPIRVERKKAHSQKHPRNPQKTVFTVHPVGVQDVFYLGGIETYLAGDLTIRKGDAL